MCTMLIVLGVNIGVVICKIKPMYRFFRRKMKEDGRDGG